ncbi:penicillin-binding protein [Candidatus Saccharibacteria bacterium]|nr:penicillin-binding protein [Candidatus Saccharibacteria bacterium]
MSKKLFKKRHLSVYSNLVQSRRAKKDAEARHHAQYLASLPKNPIKRFLYRLHPKRLAKFVFSKRGFKKILKITGIFLLLGAIGIGGLFAYYSKDLDAIKPGELAKRVQSTVTTYLDRNGKILWEDKGTGNYQLVVDDNGLSKYLKDATVAIEDKNFYTEGGISISGTMRAITNNIFGGSTQGGSTLTQQLVKQIFFADEAQERGLAGIPRKVKEMILAIEVERMYNKTQILDLYLNESPYGGRRNGAESAAQTYFGVHAKDLTLAQASLLAAIPQNPAVYNPYNIDGHEMLINRQHVVLDNMAEQGYITKAQAEEAKKYPIIDHLVPESTQYAGIKAPHFVQMVKAELETDLGKATVGQGGLTVTTTLDLDIQAKLEEAMNDMFSSYVPAWAGFSNGAATVEDTKTGQIVAMMGSRDFNQAGYGQDNAAIAYIQPGSTVKPFVYSELFQKKADGLANYGSGSIFKDENIDSLYGAKLYNADHTFKGPMTVRSALATSRNIPAVEAMYISGVSKTLDTIHKLGAVSYCTQGSETQVGLAAAIGGCGLKQIDLVSAYSTLARLGAYVPQATILEVKNTSNEVLKKWTATAPVQIIDQQSAYIIADILHDDVARAPLDGRHAKGMEIPNVPTSTKTGTSDKGGNAKDIWMASYSPVLTMAAWLGNSDATILKNGTSSIPGSIIAKVMSYAHLDIYAKQGLWKSGDWYDKPAGIQTVNGELYPSWWNKDQGQTKVTMIFDKVSKKKATDFTPDAAKISLEVSKYVDPITKKDAFVAPDGYDASADDDVHKATDVAPSISVGWSAGKKPNTYTIKVSVTPGTFSTSSVEIKIGGEVATTLDANSSDEYDYDITLTSSDTSQKSISATVTDSGYYMATGTSSSNLPVYSH